MFYKGFYGYFYENAYFLSTAIETYSHSESNYSKYVQIVSHEHRTYRRGICDKNDISSTKAASKGQRSRRKIAELIIVCFIVDNGIRVTYTCTHIKREFPGMDFALPFPTPVFQFFFSSFPEVSKEL